MKRKILAGFLFSFIFLGLTAACLILLFGDSLFPGDFVIPETLSQVDEMIRSGRLAEAQVRVLSLSRRAANEADWRSLLARAHGISRAGGSYGFFADIARKSLLKFPSNDNLRLVACKALLLVKDYAGALTLVSGLEGNPLADGLKAECAFRLLSSSPPGFGGFALKTFDFASLAAVYTNDPAMFVNAALLSLRMGSRAGAAMALERAFRSGGLVPIEVAEDAGANSLVLEIARAMPASPENELAQCEALLALGRLDEARDLLKSFVSAHPFVSCKPWLNLAAIALSDDEREYYVMESYQHFPRNAESVLAAAEYLRQKGDYKEAVGIATALPGWKNNPSLSLSALRSTTALAGPEDARSKILYCLAEFPDDSVLESVLIGELMRQGLWSDAFGALERFLSRNRDLERSDPFVFFSALASLSRDDIEQAIREFESSGTEPYQFHPPFALGTLYAYDQSDGNSMKANIPDYEKAMYWFSLAETKTKDPELKALCYKAMGKIRLRRGERDPAAALFLKAMQFDPSDAELDSFLSTATENK